jgi:hypothetical protein
MSRICLGKSSIVGSTGENFKILSVLPVEIVYKKITILLTVKNYKKFLDAKSIRIQREMRAFNFKLNYCRKSFGQKYIDYLGPTFYNSMPLLIKKQIHLWLLSLII